MSTIRPLTAKEAADLSTGWLAFGPVNAPWRPLLRMDEAAQALGAIWERRGTGARPNTRFIRDRLQDGSLEGIDANFNAAVSYKRAGTEIEAEGKGWTRICRASLMKFAAVYWTTPADERRRAVVDYARGLGAEQLRLLIAELQIMQAAQEEKLNDFQRGNRRK